MHSVAQQILVAQNGLNRLGDAAQTPCSFLMLGFESADHRRCGRVAHFEPLENHVLLRVMVGIRVVLKVVDGREDDLVIRSFAAIDIVEVLRQEHRNIEKLLWVLERELTAFATLR